MIRSILIASLISVGGFSFSHFNIGYTGAGKKYISKHREKRKSIRPGYYYYGGRSYGTRGFRGGK